MNLITFTSISMFTYYYYDCDCDCDYYYYSLLAYIIIFQFHFNFEKPQFWIAKSIKFCSSFFMIHSFLICIEDSSSPVTCFTFYYVLLWIMLYFRNEIAFYNVELRVNFSSYSIIWYKKNWKSNWKNKLKNLRIS